MPIFNKPHSTESHQIKEELEPCPFCGYNLHLSVLKNAKSPQPFEVFCHGCGARGGASGQREKAVALWNNRDQRHAVKGKKP